MTFVVVVYVPEGIVMASDSRQSITIEATTPEGQKLPPVQTIASDFTYKTFLLKQQKVGISLHGDSLLGGVQMESHIKRLQEEKLRDSDTVDEVVDKLISYFRERFPEANTSFYVADFKKEEEISVPHAYRCHIGRNEKERVNFDMDAKRVRYTCSWGGQIDVISTMLKAYQILGPDNKPAPAPKFPIIYDAMNLQDAIDFAIYAVRITIDTIRFQARPKNVGGEIDVLLLTPEEATWVQRKDLHGSILK
ncbi:MAG: hypothetical protein E3J65_05660 [Dehalococcoidia bacterium]|nr:MAG: hypothetical protein E3J65_05660 [Dehalococcoidia bacterium]